MNPMIKIEHLSKDFGEIQAVNDLSFSVREGELFAFLGSNGAGKSTTINIICGQLPPDAGCVTIDGHDLISERDAVKQKIGVVFQNSLLDRALTVRDNLKSRAALYGITGEAFEKRLSELSSLLAFEDLLPRTFGKLSGGQKRRIDIARALIHHPKILILDEPTTGLDPTTRHLLWSVIAKLRQEEHMTVLLTTHYMEEAAEADDILLIDSGRIAAEGTPFALKSKYTADYITLYGAKEEDILPLNVPYTILGGAIRLSVKSTALAAELIRKHPSLFTDFEITKGKMDDVFLAVTGKKLTGGEEK